MINGGLKRFNNARRCSRALDKGVGVNDKGIGGIIEKDVEFHRYQWTALNSTKRFIIMIAGKRGGKTHCGGYWFFKEICNDPYSDYLLAAPTYKILNQASLPLFKGICADSLPLKWNEQRQQFQIMVDNGGIIYCRSTDDPDSIESMGCRGIWADELGKMKWGVWNKFEQRVAQKEGKIFGTTSWYSQNWLYHEIYLKRKHDIDYEIIEFSTNESPWFPKAEYERLRRLHTDERTGKVSNEFMRDFEAKCIKSEGLVYSDFDRQKHVIKPFNIPADWCKFNGLDLGYNAPTALIACAIAPDGTIYAYDEYYNSRALLSEHALNIIRRGYKGIETFADKRAAQEIAELNSYGLNIIPYVEIEKNVGISRISRLLLKDKIKVFDTCLKTIDEFETYHWKPERDYNDKLDDVVKKFDHLLDAFRYAVTSTQYTLPKARDIEFNYKPKIYYDSITGVPIGYEDVSAKEEIYKMLRGSRPQEAVA